MARIDLQEKVLSANDKVANRLRDKFAKTGTLVINIASSPGSGKTSLLEKILPTLAKKYKLAVIEGDLRTENDAERLRKLGINAVQIQTGDACHLEAAQVETVVDGLNIDNLDLLIIENIGNLVCPASYDLSEDIFIVMLSVAEGDDKPAKYPTIFYNADYFVLNKVDLLPYVDFSVDKCIKYASDINSDLEIFQLSACSGEGVENFIKKLSADIDHKRATRG